MKECVVKKNTLCKCIGVLSFFIFFFLFYKLICFLIDHNYFAFSMILPSIVGSVPVLFLYRKHKTIVKLSYDTILFFTASVLMIKYIIYTYPGLVNKLLLNKDGGEFKDFFDMFLVNRNGYALLIILGMCALSKALTTANDLFEEIYLTILKKRALKAQKKIDKAISKFLW
ncbi:hypothetical protein Q4667_001835 [Salmonella enterica]|uniref:hypothetical protein n=1 Tax=Enterobacteriaceae TaxID=543 RepID=UPI00200B1E43|nr:hypothetical protein [Citrobacter koseri]EDU3496237.1 hypothetical protein [Salmonella enterica subsp. enterica serovar Brazos]EEF8200245.1 hypothetical protein [Salmonella enterica]HBW8010588.1 hypothetical protein [Klebsiella pneumoniae]EJQ3117344.1 hypothetical protein [Salmonella enterica]ELL5149183.1 hypothetical protein [Salmonella enterica]